MTSTEQTVDVHLALSLYRQMLVIRKFEESALDLFARGLMTGSTHPCIGQEAISAGACSALEPTDLILATYRGHGAALAKGANTRAVMAELLTRETGCCKGRGGSMHLCDVSSGLLGTNGIVAAHIPIAGGVALAAKLRNSGQVTVCFFGDGASCEGEFFETMNMAALWKLPLIFICENNGWAISVPVSQSQSTPDIADRAKGFGMSGVIVDGNDLLAVREAVLAAAAASRLGAGPTLIECKTVRWERHSAFSSGKPADPDAAQRWRKADPIPRFAKFLLAAGLNQNALTQAERQAAEEIRDAVEFAVASSLPGAASVHEGIYAPSNQPLGISGSKKPLDNGLAEFS